MKTLITMTMAIVGVCLFFLLTTGLAHEGLYAVEGGVIEFREVARRPLAGDWELMKDVNGEKFYVSPEIIISSADIESILVKRDETNSYTVKFHFVEDSWQRIGTVTRTIFYLAMIQEDTIIVELRLFGPFYEAAEMRNFSDRHLRILLRVLSLLEERPTDNRGAEYRDWLVANVSDQRMALELSRLADEELCKQNYEEAAMILETLISEYPNWLELYLSLGESYFGMSKYDKAIMVFQRALLVDPPYLSYDSFVEHDLVLKEYDYDIIVRMFLGTCYAAKGEYESAIVQYQYVLDALKQTDLTNEHVMRNIARLEDTIETLRGAD